MHFTFPVNSCSNAFSASRLSPWINMLSKISFLLTRCGAWYDFSGSSMRILGSSRGRSSFPIQVSSSFVCLPKDASFYSQVAGTNDSSRLQPLPRHSRGSHADSFKGDLQLVRGRHREIQLLKSNDT